MSAPSDPSEKSDQRSFVARLWGLQRTARRVVSRWARRTEEEKALTEAVTALIEQPTEPGEEAGQEKALLTNIVALGERTIADCMRPRADIIAVEAGVAFADLVKIFSLDGHSRLPVYLKELDSVIGMIHFKDVMACISEGRTSTIESLLRPVPFVPPTKPVLDLLLEMRQARHHLAIVVDEFGGVDGLITIEDLVEQIVGEINDEHDETTAPSFTVRPDGSWLIDARMPLGAFSERVPLPLSPEEMEESETLGGLVLSLANRVPRRGETFIHASGYRFEVIDADRRRIKRIRLCPPDAAGTNSHAEAKDSADAPSDRARTRVNG